MKPCHLIFSPKLGVNAISFGIYNKMSPFGHLAFLGTTGFFLGRIKSDLFRTASVKYSLSSLLP